MKKLIAGFMIFVFAAVLCANVSYAQNEAPSDEKTALLKEMFDAMQLEKMMDQMMAGITQPMKSQMPAIMDGIIEQSGSSSEISEEDRQYFYDVFMPKYMDRLMKAVFGNMDIETLVNEIYVPIYSKYFTIEEVQAIIDFYESPAGKKMLESTPAIMSESMGQMMNMFTPVMMQEIKTVTDEMNAEMKEYLESKE